LSAPECLGRGPRAPNTPMGASSIAGTGVTLDTFGSRSSQPPWGVHVKTKAAILWEVNTPWSVEDIELDEPKDSEVLVKIAASGLCHSDEHLMPVDLRVELPLVGGHEGAGVVEQVAANVSWLAPGAHVVFGFIPSC